MKYPPYGVIMGAVGSRRWTGKRLKALYYMANPVQGKSLCSGWYFLGQDFTVRTVSMETVQSVYFCFGESRQIQHLQPRQRQKSVKIVILRIETTSRS